MPKPLRTTLPRWGCIAAIVGMLIGVLVMFSGRAQSLSRSGFYPLLLKEASSQTGLRLLISEVVYDPPPEIAEPGGEWVEIYNFGGEAVLLSGIKVGDAERQGDSEGMFQFPAQTFLPPDTTIVIANRAQAFEQWYGRLPDFEFYDSNALVPNMIRYSAYATGVLSLSNGGDEVYLLDEENKMIDALSWGDSVYVFDPAVAPVASGYSLERWPASRDRDIREDWIAQPQPQPQAVKLRMPTPTATALPSATATPTRTATPTKTATPTRTPTPTRTATPTATNTWSPPPSQTPFPTAPPGIDLLVSEVYFEQRSLQRPFEWFELYNAGSSALDLTGFRAGNAKSASEADGLFIFPDSYEMLPDAVLLVASRGDYFRDFYGSTPDFELQDTLADVPELAIDPSWGSGAFDLDAVNDEILILNSDGLLVDAVCWGVSSFAFWPTIPSISPGSSLARNPANQDTDSMADWSEQTLPDPGMVVTE